MYAAIATPILKAQHRFEVCCAKAHRRLDKSQFVLQNDPPTELNYTSEGCSHHWTYRLHYTYCRPFQTSRADIKSFHDIKLC